jgi:uncharacterized membrane protein
MADAEPNERRGAREQMRAYLLTLDGRLLLAEILFVAGWSSMWATSLHIIPFVPTAVWLALMALGLLLAAILTKPGPARSRREAHVGKRPNRPWNQPSPGKL